MENNKHENYKGKLQELCTKFGTEPPIYEIGVSGGNIFGAYVSACGDKVSAFGPTLKVAEQRAARQLYQMLIGQLEET